MPDALTSEGDYACSASDKCPSIHTGQHLFSSFSATTSARQIKLKGSGPWTLYVPGDVTIRETGFVDEDGRAITDPHLLTILAVDSTAGKKPTVSIGNQCSANLTCGWPFYGSIVAPTGTVVKDGYKDFSGAIVGDSVTWKGTGNLQIDTSLDTAPWVPGDAPTTSPIALVR